MDAKQFEKLHETLQLEIYKLREAVKIGPIHSLAVVELAREFYSDEERRKLLADYCQMQLDAENLRKAHSQALRENSAVEGTGKAYDDAWNANRAFAKEHPLIHELYEARRELCNRDHRGKFDLQAMMRG